MRKLLLLLSLFFLTLLAADEKVEIYATSMDSKGDNVLATEGVTVIYQGYYLSADRAKYNRVSGDLELFGSVRINRDNEYKVLGKYAKLNIAKKERLFEPLYLLDKDTKLWLSAVDAKAHQESIDISSGVLSGCDPMDPLWSIEFSSSDYNTKSKWMNIYNARLYIEDIPILYTPYFGYSLDTTRRTGLLMPSIGVSDNEGVYYEQPIYIAEYNWWDLELRPQVRTLRGEGIYETFRFVDGANSQGSFKAGYFQEHEAYFNENSLQNDSHYGFNFKYNNGDFINQWLGTNIKGQTGIYVDINYMNDVDYINLHSNNTQIQETATQVLSRTNIFYNTQNYYLGAYFKYYLDLTKANNDDTTQEIPTLQYHYYLETLLQNHLLYSLDVKSNNIVRTKDINVVQTDINLPITLQTSLLDEYLNLSYKANLYMQDSRFSGKDAEIIEGVNYRNGYYARNYHTLSTQTQLTRRYDSFSHVVGFGVTYNKSGSSAMSGFYQDVRDANETIEAEYDFYQISEIEDELQLDFEQYFYNNKTEQFIYHRMAQKISYDEKYDQFGELENELDYALTKEIHFYNNMFFNYGEKLFSKLFNTLSYQDPSIRISLSHLYKDSFIEKTSTLLRYTNYLTSNIEYNYNKHYSYDALFNYDIESKEKKNMSLGFSYKKRCWEFGLRYSENNRPILSSNGTSSSIYDRYIYLNIVLKPLMKSNKQSSFLTYKLEE